MHNQHNIGQCLQRQRKPIGLHGYERGNRGIYEGSCSTVGRPWDPSKWYIIKYSICVCVCVCVCVGVYVCVSIYVGVYICVCIANVVLVNVFQHVDWDCLCLIRVVGVFLPRYVVV